MDCDGYLNLNELSLTLRKPEFAQSAMENFNPEVAGLVSLGEWISAHKSTFDKSAAASKTALKAIEKFLQERIQNPIGDHDEDPFRGAAAANAVARAVSGWEEDEKPQLHNPLSARKDRENLHTGNQLCVSLEEAFRSLTGSHKPRVMPHP